MSTVAASANSSKEPVADFDPIRDAEVTSTTEDTIWAACKWLQAYGERDDFPKSRMVQVLSAVRSLMGMAEPGDPSSVAQFDTEYLTCLETRWKRRNIGKNARTPADYVTKVRSLIADYTLYCSDVRGFNPARHWAAVNVAVDKARLRTQSRKEAQVAEAVSEEPGVPTGSPEVSAVLGDNVLSATLPGKGTAYVTLPCRREDFTLEHARFLALTLVTSATDYDFRRRVHPFDQLMFEESAVPKPVAKEPEVQLF
jgi:hypothetical protein